MTAFFIFAKLYDMTLEQIVNLLQDDDDLFEYILKKVSDWYECGIEYAGFNQKPYISLNFVYNYINDDYDIDEELDFDFTFYLPQDFFSPLISSSFDWLDNLIHLPQNKLREKQIVKLRLTYLFWLAKETFDSWVINDSAELQKIERDEGPHPVKIYLSNNKIDFQVK